MSGGLELMGKSLPMLCESYRLPPWKQNMRNKVTQASLADMSELVEELDILP